MIKKELTTILCITLGYAIEIEPKTPAQAITLAQAEAQAQAEAGCPGHDHDDCCGGCGCCHSHCCCDCDCDHDDEPPSDDNGSWTPQDCYDDTNCFEFTLADCPAAMYSLNDSKSATFDLFDLNYTPGHTGCMNVCEFAMMRECLITYVHTGWSSSFDNPYLVEYFDQDGDCCLNLDEIN